MIQKEEMTCFSVAIGRNSSGFVGSTWLHMFEKSDVLQEKEAKISLKFGKYEVKTLRYADGILTETDLMENLLD